MVTLRSSCFLVVALFVLTLGAGAQTKWTIVDYPGADWTQLNGINSQGDAVGSYHQSGRTRGFLLSRGIFTPLDFPGAEITNAEGINDSGDIVGTYSILYFGLVPTGFILHNGMWSTIRVPGREYTWVHGINTAGDVVGESQLHTGTIGFLRKKGMGYTRIVVPGAASTKVKGINNAGDIVGYFYNGGEFSPERGFLLRDGVWQLLDLPNGNRIEVNTINDNHQIAGQASSPLGDYQGFLRSNDHFFIVSHLPVAEFLWVTGLNNQAEVVGYYYHNGGVSGPFHGFIRSH